MDSPVKKYPYRLGIDLGTNSLGWCVTELDTKNPAHPIRILRTGVRIFSDGREPKRGESLAVARRTARGMRRRRDRFLGRKGGLMQLLVSFGLMPKNRKKRKKLESLNPYELRAKAVDEKVALYELGRALYHLNQRRGFLSNRKTASKDEMKVIGPKIEELKNALEQSSAKTLGHFLYLQLKEGKSARIRDESNLYPTRSMYREEFLAIKKQQKLYHPEISENNWKELEHRIFFQRDLKPQEPGRCQLYPEEHRVPAALPSHQQFRIAQDCTNLAIIDTKGNKTFLDATQRQILWDALQKQKTLKFTSIAKKLNLPDEIRFNLEDKKRKELKGNPTAILLSKKEYFGKQWFDYPDDFRDQLVLELMNIEDPEALIQKAETEWKLSKDTAKQLAELTPEDFIKGYGRFGKTALGKLLPLMRDEGLQYHEAVEKIGKHHSDRRPDKIHPSLDYYGKLMPEAVFIHGDPSADEKTPEKKYGKIGNPTVHIGLNQLRLVTNEIIKTFGHPMQIVVELARDLKLNQQQKKNLIQEQSRNQKNNERIAKELATQGLPNNGLNRLKFKLWEELNEDLNDRRCPFSGTKICIASLFSHEIEIEHILPLSKTLDDSQNNKTLSTRRANGLKANRSPYDAFGGNGSPFDFVDILERASKLPKRKFLRFLPEAMEKFENEREFFARQLNDTRYLSKIAKQYLNHICSADQVWVIPGILTSMLRHKLGLNSILGKDNKKDRNDHRHHAIDALVTALTDRSLLQQVSRFSGAGLLDTSEKENDPYRVRLIAPEPWPKFRREAEEAILRTIVSHKPDHGKQAKLHEDTAYGIITPNAWEKENGYNVVRRKPVADLSRKELNAVRDPLLREKFLSFSESFDPDKDKELKLALPGFAGKLGVKRVRLLKKENPIREIRHPARNPRHVKAVAPGEIHHVALWKLPDGKIEPKGVSYYDLNAKDHNCLRPHPAARLVMKIHKGDMMRLEHKGREKTARVVSLSPENNNAWLVEHFEGGDLTKRQKEKSIFIFQRFSRFQQCKVRKIFIDPLGRIRDPGDIWS